MPFRLTATTSAFAVVGLGAVVNDNAMPSLSQTVTAVSLPGRLDVVAAPVAADAAATPATTASATARAGRRLGDGRSNRSRPSAFMKQASTALDQRPIARSRLLRSGATRCRAVRDQALAHGSSDGFQLGVRVQLSQDLLDVVAHG